MIYVQNNFKAKLYLTIKQCKNCFFCLQTDTEKEFAEISDFIDLHPFFSHMPTKLKKLLEMSLRKETFIFDTVLIKQGEPVQGLHFILK